MGSSRRLLAAAGILIAAGGLAAAFGRFGHAPLPDEADLANPARNAQPAAYDVLGRPAASPEPGAVRIDDALIRRGREAFYRETFGNEVFLTDVMGMLDGALSLYEVSRALTLLAGRGTTNLEVRVARPVTVGGRTYQVGELIPTGLDVAKGSLFPLGIRTFYDRGHVRMGITCALCHAAYDPGTGKVVDGAPNRDLNVGLMMALASNTTAYYMHGSTPSLDPFRTDPNRSVATRAGGRERLPDPEALEAAAKVQAASWPPGSFDSSPDLVTNPTSIPSSFTAHGHPYGWSGHAGIGPFRGLSALNNNVHALNSDTTAQADAAPFLFGLDPEVYLGTLLQRAPSPSFRFDPQGGRTPSQVLKAADPTPDAPGLNSYAALPSFPNANYVTTNGLVATSPGEPVGYANDAMSAFQNALRAPARPAPPEILATGRQIFERAGCAGCHAGPAYTNNRVVPAPEIGTEPTRARSFAKTEGTLRPPDLYAAGTPFPVPPGTKTLPVPLGEADRAQVQLAWAHAGTPGGYKVPNLIGLNESAPYLHDGGVAVGPGPAREPGIGPLLDPAVQADPAESLRALVDRDLRARVIAANRASPRAVTARVTGEGHAYWADAQAGVGPAEQAALVQYLLCLDGPAR
ncbi:cytochrome c5 [Methylobacterium sp. BE186]|uniref:cytochrome C oxidase Cbb3 n=1 Tax=Methylobacterium sp. BE186 TaxID=2817715 RepID=UPI00285A88EA|nr:cytochrome C oxidase Cbb3 [Methylobacterium sp. BE186]MDR7039641.1 cytochrome c5 [Methylobacterium sp. BE186]